MEAYQLEVWTRWKVYFHNVAAGEHVAGFDHTFDLEPTEENLIEVILQYLDGRDMFGHFVIDIKKSIYIHEKDVMPAGNVITQEQLNDFNNRTKGLRFSTTPSKKQLEWKNILGFIPEIALETDDHSKCYKCKSENFIKHDSPAWTGMYKCKECHYYTYIIYQDKMGTVLPDSVAVDKRFSTMIPSNIQSKRDA